MALRPVLLGFSDFFDEVGAATTRTAPPPPKSGGTVGPPPSTKPTGQPVVIQQGTPRTQKLVKKRPYGSIKQTKIVAQHGKVMSKAKQTLLKAARGIGRAQVALAQHAPSHAAVVNAAAKTAVAKAAAAKAAQASTIATQAPSTAAVRTAAVARGVAARSILGAVAAAVQAKKQVAPAVTAKMTPKAKAAVEKHNKAVAAAKQAAQKLAQQTLKTRQSVKELAQAAVNQKKVSMLLRTPVKARGTHVGSLLGHPVLGEEIAEALGEYYDMVGATPDPANPGYLTDGTPDPAVWGTDPSLVSPTDPSLTTPSLLDTSTTATLATLTEDQQDQIDALIAFQGQPAPPPNQPTEPDYKAVGGILYNESKGRPNGFCLSYGLLTRTSSIDAPGGPVAGSDPGINDYGYVWGSFDRDSVPNGTPWGGRLTEGVWNEIHGRYVRSGEGSFNNPVSPEEAYASNSKQGPGGPYGPLVGNDGMADFKGMRVDAQGNMFWYPQEAPDWLTLPLKQAAALTDAKNAKAAADEQKQFQLEQEKLARDNAAAQAAQDAANALAESQAASDARITESQEAATQAQQETQYNQQLMEQAQQEAQQEQQAQDALIQAAAQQTQFDAQDQAQEQQAATLMIQQAQQQQALLAQNPDIALALMAQQAGLLGPDGGDGSAAAADDGGVAVDDSGSDDTTAAADADADAAAADYGSSDFFADASDFSEG